MPRVAVLNCGNRRSVVKALEHLGAEICPEIGEATHCIIPGVGTMASVMEAIGHVRAELEWFREQGRPILGICAGMHAMCMMSAEGNCEGLGWFGRVVVKMPEPTPIQGWKRIWSHHDEYIGCYYFSHSYGLMRDDGEIAESLRTKNTIGVQYHPEKSQADGLFMLKWFLDLEPWTP